MAPELDFHLKFTHFIISTISRFNLMFNFTFKKKKQHHSKVSKNLNYLPDYLTKHGRPSIQEDKASYKPIPTKIKKNQEHLRT